MSGSAAAVDDRPALAVQVVLFETDESAVRRQVSSLARAVGRVEDRISSATLIIGDSSPRPCLDEAVVDDLRRLAGQTRLDVRYLFFDANLGSAEGNNRLLSERRDDLVLLLNPDAVPAPSLLVELLGPLDDPTVGLVEARQLPLEHPKPFDSRTGETTWATMACLLARRETLDEVGPLDSSSFFLYCDDVDYSWRTRLAGWSIRYRPSAIVFHDKRLSAAGHYVASETMQFYCAEGALLLAHKYGRPDAVQWLHEFYESGNEVERLAVKSFDHRRDRGRVPEPLADGPSVAEFGHRAFSAHRF